MTLSTTDTVQYPVDHQWTIFNLDPSMCSTAFILYSISDIQLSKSLYLFVMDDEAASL